MADLTPVTREEQFLDKIAEALETGGGVYSAMLHI